LSRVSHKVHQSPQEHNAVVRFFAHFFSFIFHPLFIAAYVTAFLIFVHPIAFAGFDPKLKMFRLISVFFVTVFLPFFSIFLLLRLRFISSVYLRTARERVIPYAIVMIFYFWIWYVFYKLDSPPVIVHFLLGAFLAVCAAWMCNIFYKISIHSVAMGGLLMFFLLFSFHDSYASGVYLSLATLIAGLVCTSRFIVSDHSAFDIYTGLLTGMLTQFIAWQF